MVLQIFWRFCLQYRNPIYFIACIIFIFAFKVNAEQNFEIEGVSSGDIESNIRAYLNDLSDPFASMNYERYAKEIKQEVSTALDAYAYYDAEIEVTLVDEQENDDASSTFTWKIAVSLGNQTKVANVVLVNDLEQVAADAMPQDLLNIVNKLKGFKGQVLNHEEYESVKAKLRSYALLYGFFDFSFPLHKLIIEPQKESGTSEAIIHWIFNFGQRYKFGALQYLQSTTGKDLVEEVKTFKKGQYFDQSKISQFSIDMQSTRYFDRAIARANAEKAKDGVVPIEVILSPKAKNKYNFGLGVSTDTGPRFTFEWQRPWVNLDGHAFTTNLFVSRPQQSIEFGYRMPKGNPLNDFVNIQLGYKKVSENQTESDNVSLAIQRQFGAEEEGGWDYITFLRYSQERFSQGLEDERITTALLMPGFTVNRLRKRGDIFVDWGDRQQITISGASKEILSDIDFAKLLIRTKWIRSIGEHRFIFRADAGAIATNSFEEVPSTERFFAGGDQSVRGFGLNELADYRRVIEDSEEQIELIGGRYLAVASAEYAYKVADNWRAAVFADVGNATEKFASDLAYGVGIGAHYLSPIGTVRVYIARGDSQLEKTWRLHLDIGPGV
ncbi:autotransporter assembly complex protein TamA [Glaciecola sp. 1036]|uniref:autotransporter assembly complex protein TamA n=1 Tax=Alteromonadaceae TaxID=72275 RepID=UPI003D06A9A9